MARTPAKKTTRPAKKAAVRGAPESVFTDPFAPTPDPRDAQIAALEAALAHANAPRSTAQVDHVSDDELAACDPGQLVRYTTAPDNGADAEEGYALVLDVVTVDDETGGDPRDGQETRTEVLIAPLALASNRLPASQVLGLIG